MLDVQTMHWFICIHLPRGNSLMGYICMTVLVALLYMGLTDIYIIYKTNGEWIGICLLTNKCCILLLIIKNKSKISYQKCCGSPTGCCECCFGMSINGCCIWYIWFVECIIGSNMSLYFNDNHIFYCYMDTYRSIMLGHNYFTSTDYLSIQGWITATHLYPANIALARPNINWYFQFFPGVVKYFHSGYSLVPFFEL